MSRKAPWVRIPPSPPVWVRAEKPSLSFYNIVLVFPSSVYRRDAIHKETLCVELNRNLATGRSMEEALSIPRPPLSAIFGSFFRLGLTAFGGPSMVAYIRKMSVDEKGWLDKETFDHGVALCQMVPGATAMQTAAFVGLQARGVSGAAASFIGFGLPAFFLMIGIAAAYTITNRLPVVISTFSGLQAIIIAIVANAALSFGRSTLKSWRHFAIAGGAGLLFGLNLNPVWVILIAGGAGWVLFRSHLPALVSNSQRSSTPSTTRPLIAILFLAAAGFFLLFLFRRDWFDLAALFTRIDLFAFGGGFASIPLMYHEVVDVRHWMDSATFLNGIALGQVTPGPIVITATFIGYLLKGLWGAVLATIAVFLPSFTIVIGVTPYFNRLRASSDFNQIIQGVLCSFVGLLLAVTLQFAVKVQWDIAHALLAVAALIALIRKVDILWVVIAGILLSLLLIR